MSKRTMYVVALLAAFTLIAAACGDDDEPTTAAPTTAAPTTAAPTTAAPTTAAPTTAAPTTAAPTTAAPTTAAPTTTADPGRADGDFKLGYVLPQTGALSVIKDSFIQAVLMAESEIQAAGGQITVIAQDSGTDPAVASVAVDQLIAENVDVIVGAASSGVSLSVIDKIISAGIPQCSPSNTGKVFTTYADEGNYFRTAPPDNLQAQAIADVIATEGSTNVAIVFRDDIYGVGFDEDLSAELTSIGIDVTSISYDKDATSFDAEVAAVTAAGVDAVVLITFAEGAQLAQSLIEAGLGQDTIQWYGTDGWKDNVPATAVSPDNPGIISGMLGTYPSLSPPGGEPTFEQRFTAFAPEGTPKVFSAHTFDCVIVLALAALVAGSDDPDLIRAEINGVTKGGTRCFTYASCRALVLDGTDIDYDGAAGPLDFVDAGEPGVGVYDVYLFADDGSDSNILEITIP